MVLLALLGFGVGALGTLVGAGGGFIVVPLLIMAFHTAPATAAGTSLVMVTVTALTGTIAYARQNKVDWYGGLFLAATGYPGTILGAWLGPRLQPRHFSQLFGAVLVLLAAWMIYRNRRGSGRQPARAGGAEAAALQESAAASDPPGPAQPGQATVRRGFRLCRRLVERHGPIHAYCFFMPVAALLSFGIAFLGGMLGIGGGPLLVPAMIYALDYPVHIATATSQLIIALTAFAAAAVHVETGHVMLARALALSLGALAGAPTGAWLSRWVAARHLVVLLAAMLLFLGLRLIAA